MSILDIVCKTVGVNLMQPSLILCSLTIFIVIIAPFFVNEAFNIKENLYNCAVLILLAGLLSVLLPIAGILISSVLASGFL